MSRILTYLSNAISGVRQYFADYKLIVLFLVTLLAMWILKEAKEKTDRLLVYSLVMTVCLMCPITAVAVLIYQTAYYDYQWAFSMVPVTIVTAYGLTFLCKDKLKQKRQFGVVLVAITALLFLGGNQGNLQKLPQEDSDAKIHAENILESIKAVRAKQECVVWAPKRIMQQLRRNDGEILLLYGRDMWDGKAGAYDYEVYPDTSTDAYIWLEKVTSYADAVLEFDEPYERVGEWLTQYELLEQASVHLSNVMQSGANTIVLPVVVKDCIGEILIENVNENGCQVEEIYTEQYIIYLIN